VFPVQGQQLPAVGPPRLVRKAESFLATYLEPGETLTTAVRVQTGSLLAYLVVGIAAFILLGVGLDQSPANMLPQGVFGGLFIAGYIAIVSGASWLVLKPRLLAITDRRLFLFKMTGFLGRVSGIETEEVRDSVRARLIDKDRVVVSGAQGRAISIRVTYSYRYIAAYLRDWASSQDLDG